MQAEKKREIIVSLREPSLCFGTCSHNNGGHCTDNNTPDEIILVVRCSTHIIYQNLSVQRPFAGQVSPTTDHPNACGKYGDC